MTQIKTIPQKMDAILAFTLCTDGPSHIVTLRKKALPECGNDEILDLLRRMQAKNSTVAGFNLLASAESIWKNGNTEEFLENGGFVGFSKHEQLERDKTKNEARLAKWQVYVFWPLVLLSPISVFYSGYDLFINGPKVTNQLNKQKEEIKQLKTDLKILNDRFKGKK